MREAVALDPIDRALVTALQDGIPLTPRPYRTLADALGISEQQVVDRIASLLSRKVLTRFGPMFDAVKLGGAFMLAALIVPEDRWDEVCAKVNALPEVAHNYRREHEFNMWFVLGTETPQGIDAAVARIESETGLTVYAFPKEREFFVELKFVA